MGNDEHHATEACYMNYFGKNHLFHVVRSDFPSIEEGIIGQPFLNKFDKYLITPDYLVVDNKKTPLIREGKYLQNRTMTLCKISINERDQDIWVENHDAIPDGIYQIKNRQVRIPYFNYHKHPVKIPDTIKYDKIMTSRPVPNSTKTSDTHDKIMTSRSVPNSTKISDTHDKSPGNYQRLTEVMRNTNLSHLEPHVKNDIMKLITVYQEVFSLPHEPLPCTNLTEHEIILNSGKTINLRSHKLPQKHHEFSLEETQKLLKKGIIRHSQSPFNSPLWVVPKKGDKLRMVIDYRQINKDTDQDAYPLPLIDDILDQLGKARFFSAFDMSAGFHQIPMEEGSKKYTAFSTTQGHFEYNRMPFGLKNAPATFQRLMDNAFRGLIGKSCFAYIDDIVIFGNTLEEHNRNLQLVLQRVKELGLRLEPTKCEYLKPELEYLGHLITADGVKPNPAKIEAIKNFKNLKTVKDVQSFLGLAGYYRKFIKNFSSIARPLTRLTQKEMIFDWTPDCEKAFYDLRHALTTAPVLRFPNFEEQFTLTTDASNHGLGAVLSQNGHPCLFISRTLNKAEENYTTSEKELLAMVWAMKRLRQYLLGKTFKIQTDHKALVWLHNVKDPSSRLLRWRLRMEEYKYEIEYVKGKENKVADCLSRLFPLTLDDCIRDAGITDEQPTEEETPRIEISNTPVTTTKEPENEVPMELEEIENILATIYERYTDWKKDPKDSGKIKIKPNAAGKLWKEINKDKLGPYNEKKWLSQLIEISTELRDKGYTILRMAINDPLITPLEKETIQTMIEYISTMYAEENFHLCFNNIRELTKEERKAIMEEAHKGHLGEHKTLDQARKLGHWIGLDKDVIKYVKKCPICQLQKTTRIRNQAESIIPEVPLKPNDKIALDIYGPLPTTKKGNKYVLSLQDRLTRYTILIPLMDTDSATLIESLIEHYIYIYIWRSQDYSHRPGNKLRFGINARF